MRLHHLELTAFGPFADTQRVDFDALASGGVFLFTGATGAGKTSILDAVCFALYGQVPGARQHAREVRSDHAADDVRPQVVLEVTLRGRRLRVTRSPSWTRPKRRGSGTTSEQARVLLQERVGGAAAGWSTLSTRLDEAGHLLGRLLGLTLGQFCSVALLPQGQFAEFLQADADRRAALLESLFDTGRFAAVEAWLVASRRTAWSALESSDRKVAAVLARVAEAAGTDLPEDGSWTGDDAAVLGWLDGLRADARQVLAGAAESEMAADAAREAAATALQAAARVRDRQQRLADLVRRQAELEVERAARDAAADELVAARRVAPLMPLLAEVARLQTELEQARGAVAAARVRVQPELAATGTAGGPARGGQRRQDGPALSTVQRRAAAARAEVGRLGRLAEQEAEAGALVQESDRLERSIVALSEQADRVTAWLADAVARRATLVAAREAAAAAGPAVTGLVAEHDQVTARLAAARRRDHAAEAVLAGQDELRRLTDLAQDARSSWLGLRQARLDGMAAELAAGLHRGEACPVCGSGVHPSPAVASAAPVTREQEDRAGRAHAAAEADRGAAAERLAALEVGHAEQRSLAGGGATVAELAAAAELVGARLGSAQAVWAGLAGAEEAVAAFDEQRESRVREQVTLAQRRADARGRVEEQRARLRELLEVLDAARGDDPTIQARVARLERLADDCEGLARAVTELERLDGAVADALDRAEAYARDRQVESLDQAVAAFRDEAAVDELEALRRRHDADWAAVSAQLADPELAGAAAQPAPDLAAAAVTAERAEATHAEAIRSCSAARGRLSALDRLGDRLDAALAARAPALARHRLVDGLARLAEGKSLDNRLRMSLSGYVLAARLEQVAAAASERLLRMTSGRFSLHHTAEAGAGRGRGGLRLRVLDAWTGVERDPATLSGGESFSASLALALGLADVVTAEAGGSMLDTLFVDEGFGSLDEETLDEVMGVLDGLRDGGRVVGLVSHVAEMRQRIPVQLQVVKGRGGSLVRQ